MTEEDEVEATGSSVTVELRCGDKFLLVKRPLTEKFYAGYWAFPGGKVRAHESFVAAARRECEEEVGLDLTGKLFFVDSYPLENTTRTGIHFVFEVADDVVRTTEFPDHRWVTSVAEMAELEPRIPGLDNHAVYSTRRFAAAALLARAVDRLAHLQAQAGKADDLDVPDVQAALDTLTWSTLDETDLIRPKYYNE